MNKWTNTCRAAIMVFQINNSISFISVFGDNRSVSAVGTYPGSCLLPGNHSCWEPERRCQWRRRSCRHLMETHRNAGFNKKLKADRREDGAGGEVGGNGMKWHSWAKSKKAVDVGNEKKGDKGRNISENNDSLWLLDYDTTRKATKWGNQTAGWQKNHRRVYENCVFYRNWSTNTGRGGMLWGGGVPAAIRKLYSTGWHIFLQPVSESVISFIETKAIGTWPRQRWNFN